MPVEVSQQQNNAESKYQDILYVVSREIHELSDAEENNEKINLKWLDESITENFETELKNALKDKPQIVDQLLSACESYRATTPYYGDINFNRIYSTLLNIKENNIKENTKTNYVEITLQKEQAEIKQDEINVTLRGEWSKESWMKENGKTEPLNETDESAYTTFLDTKKREIATQLKTYTDKRDTLNDNQKTVLILAKHALESTSKENEAKEPVSGEVLVLERKLNELGYMPLEAESEDCHNGVDGKFGTKTYEALINCLEGKPVLKNAEIKNSSEIQVTLRGKWNDMETPDLEIEKQKIVDKLNGYTELWDYLPEDVQNILVLAATALKTKSDKDAKSDEVFNLERALAMPTACKDPNIHNSVDGRFGPETYKALINYIENSLKENAEIKADKIQVTLRGEWNKKDVDINQAKENITTELNDIKNKNRDSWIDNGTLNDKKAVLLLTKAALESISKDDGKGNPVSDEVLALEKFLNKLNLMDEKGTDEKHNGVDGKFGTETYKIVVAYLTNTTPDKVNINIPKINEGLKPNPAPNANNLKSGRAFLSDSDVDNENPDIANLLQLSKLDEIQAKELAKHEGKLNLSIATITNDVAAALAEHKGELHLDLLESIDKDSAIALAKHKGTELHLGIKTIEDANVATELAGYKGKLHLNGLTEINESIAKELAKHEGDLYLNGLTALDERVASALAQHKGFLSLNHINGIDNNIASILKEHEGNIQLAGKVFNAKDISKNNNENKSENEPYSVDISEVEGTITFKELRDKLPITNNGEINKIMGSIDYFDKKLNEGKSINELAAEELKLNEELNNIERQIQEVEGKKGNFDKEKGKERRELEKTTNYLKKQQEALKKRQNEINEEKDKKVDIRDKNILVLITTLTNELTKNATDDNNDAVASFINETIPEYIKGLDGQTEKKVAKEQTDKPKGAPDATPNAPKKSRQEAFKEQLENFNKATHQFVKILADRWGSLFPDSKSAKKLNTLSQQYEFEDKMKENQYIEKDGNVYKILLGLKGITDAEKADGFEEIINVIENGDENQVRELQMKLWTPENNLPITGRIDKNTSNLLKNYITKAPKDGKESLSYQCLAEGGYEEAGKINNTEKNIAGTVYKKGESGSETYIFIGTLNGETCICENIIFNSENKTISSGNNINIIHGATGEVELGTFDEKRKLTNGKRYNPDGTTKETIPAAS